LEAQVRGRRGTTDKHLLDEEPARIHAAGLLAQEARGGRVPDPPVGRLDEEPIDHGDADHAAHEHLVETRGGRQVGVGDGAFERDMLGEVVVVDEVEVGKVAELEISGRTGHEVNSAAYVT
jgi:hypothetical protein